MIITLENLKLQNSLYRTSNRFFNMSQIVFNETHLYVTRYYSTSKILSVDTLSDYNPSSLTNSNNDHNLVTDIYRNYNGRTRHFDTSLDISPDANNIWATHCFAINHTIGNSSDKLSTLKLDASTTLDESDIRVFDSFNKDLNNAVSITEYKNNIINAITNADTIGYQTTHYNLMQKVVDSLITLDDSYKDNILKALDAAGSSLVITNDIFYRVINFLAFGAPILGTPDVTTNAVANSLLVMYYSTRPIKIAAKLVDYTSLNDYLYRCYSMSLDVFSHPIAISISSISVLAIGLNIVGYPLKDILTDSVYCVGSLVSYSDTERRSDTVARSDSVDDFTIKSLIDYLYKWWISQW